MNLDKILMNIQKPTRYIGTEYGSIHKNLSDIFIRFAFCFPDVYEVGMSHLGMKILYHLLNEQSDVFCERVFAPWEDMEEEMRKSGAKLFSLETRSEICNFDFVGFTLQYEMSYSNIINMLDLAGIPLESKNRGEEFPLVCAGGPCAYNPEPLADFVDFFMMGEGEAVIVEIMDLYREHKKSGGTKKEFLKKLLSVEGVYVPCFYDVSYNDDGTIASFEPNVPEAPRKIKKRIMADLDKTYFPETIIVPFMETVHDRITLELFRGCIRGCRFCQAGMIYRPVRERSPKRLIELAKQLIENTGYEEMSMSSLSTSDYTQLGELTEGLLALTEPKKINLSLPSLRIDSFSLDLMRKVQKVRKSGLTFAPEAGTQRMRDVINKGVTEEDLMRSCELAFKGGYGGCKLYFMIGLPTETDEDIYGIADLAKKVVSVYFEVPKEIRNKNFKLTVSASSFVPKAFTPFQWEAQNTMDELIAKQNLLKETITDKKISFNWHDSSLSVLEGVFARGDRKLCKVLKRAQQLGAKFDSWHEFYKPEIWKQAFEDCAINPDFYNHRKREYDEILPWDHVDVGVSKDFLIRESERAKQGIVTENCRAKCAGCGITKSFGGDFCD